MGERHPQTVSKIKNFLISEAIIINKEFSKDSDTIKSFHAKIPLQTNFSDCGIYILMYFNAFLSDPLVYFDLLKNNIRKDEAWFTTEDALHLRKIIMDKMRSFAQEYQNDTIHV